LRAVLDVNVIVSALLSRGGTPASLLRSWVEGEFELVVSPGLLNELTRVFSYAKLLDRIRPDEARSIVELFEGSATVIEDPSEPPPVRSPDPGDDYLIALASRAQAVLVTGDEHLLGVEAGLPIVSAAAFREMLNRRS